MSSPSPAAPAQSRDAVYQGPPRGGFPAGGAAASPPGGTSGPANGLPGGVLAGPPSGPPGGGQVNPKPDPKVDPKYQQRCFKTADGTSICVTDNNQYHNTTDVFEQNGVSDRHNSYGHADKHDVAGSIHGQNMNEAAQGGNTAVGQPGPPGDIKFDSHSFKEGDGFRDTHREDPNPRNGNMFEFEDHKEDSTRDGKNSKVHSEKPDGERTDAQGHAFNESHHGVDIKDKNGAHDDVRKDASAGEYQNMYQKHHAGPDDSDAADSKVSQSGYYNADHLKDEHTDASLHTLHEEDSGKGSWSFSLTGNNALKDLFKDSQSWKPKEGDWGQSSGDWSKNLPRDETHVEVEVRTTTPEDLEERGREWQNPEFSKSMVTSSRRRRCKYRGCRPHYLDRNPASNSHEQGGIEPRDVGTNEVQAVLDATAPSNLPHFTLASQPIPRSANAVVVPYVASHYDVTGLDQPQNDGFAVGMFFVGLGVVISGILGVMWYQNRKIKKSLLKDQEARENKQREEEEEAEMSGRS